jgi:hypothetical protein
MKKIKENKATLFPNNSTTMDGNGSEGYESPEKEFKRIMIRITLIKSKHAKINIQINLKRTQTVE